MSQRRNRVPPRAVFYRNLLTFLLGIGLSPLASNGAPTFALQASLGIVNTTELTEASGIMASRQNPGVLWTHNDSARLGSVKIFALSTNGALLARYSLSSDGDYEDIGIGPGPRPGLQYIYLADIGDNYTNRSSIHVYRFPEPAVYLRQTNSPVYSAVENLNSVILLYPNGDKFNAEAMMVDPITGDVFIATKSDTSTLIYTVTQEDLKVAITGVHFVREVFFAKVSGGDISADGRLITLRRGNTAAIWTRQPGESVGDALARPGTFIPIVGEPLEFNGEAIGFHPTSLGYYTISEGVNQPIYFFRRTDGGAPRQPVWFINVGDTWRFQDLGTDEGTAWRQPAFDDSTWNSGPAQLGYGQGDELTTVDPGPATNKNVTTYFRRNFNVSSAAALNDLALRMLFTDGVAVYLNGVEVFRKNLAPDAAYDQLATNSNASFQKDWYSVALDATALRVGANTLAVELHRQLRSGLDLSFDLQLIQGAFDFSPNLYSTDSRAPTVTVTAPAANAVVTNEIITLRGTATDNGSITKIACSLGNGAFQTASGINTWSADVPLQVGTNTVNVVAYDSSSNVSAIVSRKFVRLAVSPLTVEVSGVGTVTPNLGGTSLLIGKSYVLTAKPATRNFFTGWTGDLFTNTLRLQFLMQSNLVLHANFTTNPFVATKGSYRGLFEDPYQASHEQSGAVTATVAENGKYTASLRFNGKTISLSGQLGLDGTAIKQVIVPGTSPLTVTLSLDLSDGADRLTGSIAGATWTAPLLAFRSPVFSSIHPSPYAGRYTMFINGDTNFTGPPGHSVASLVVSPAGVLTLSGTLADGVALAQSGPISRDGWWPLYVPLYKGKGSVLSWLVFTNDTTDSLRARVNWIKPAVSTDKLYPSGFTNVTTAYGSTYSAFMVTNYLAAHANPCLMVSGFASGIQTNCVVLGSGYTWHGPGIKSLKLNLATGLWSGTYTNPATSRPLPAKFTLLLQNGSGYGHVLSTNVSAAVELLPAP